MARKPYKPDIEYIQKYYSYGSEAHAVEFKPVYRKSGTKLPRARKNQQKVVYIDPVAFCGLMVAIVMLLVMTAGMIRFDRACQENQTMQKYLMQLQDQNVKLNHDYRTGYDLEQIENTALALGMIPVEEARTIPVSVTVPEPESRPTLWDEIVWFLTGLFA